jgi:hypothetical protein
MLPISAGMMLLLATRHVARTEVMKADAEAAQISTEIDRVIVRAPIDGQVLQVDQVDSSAQNAWPDESSGQASEQRHGRVTK